MNLRIALLGATASGKSQFAINLARKIRSEIVSLDSVAIYKGFDIGSAKPTALEQAEVPHHLIDCADPMDNVTTFTFVQWAIQALSFIEAKGKLPITVGGTYFYLRALEHGMYPNTSVPEDIMAEIQDQFEGREDEMHDFLNKRDPESAKKIHPNDHYRLFRALGILKHTGTLPSSLKPEKPQQTPALWLKYALILNRSALSQKIEQRVEAMLHNGLVEETQALLEKYPKSRVLQTIGYRETVSALKQQFPMHELKERIVEKTRQMAKKQLTWLRSDPEVRFIDLEDEDRVLKDLKNLNQALEK